MSGLFGGGGQTKAQQELTKTETEAAKLGLGEATKTLPKATKAIEGPLNFFQALMSGDRNTIMSVLSPETSSLTAAYDTGRQTAESFAPRGGGRAGILEALPFEKAGEIEKLIQGSQLTGATETANIGGMLAQLGLGELGTGSQVAGTAFSQIQDAKVNQQQQQAAMGAGIGSLVALLAL